MAERAKTVQEQRISNDVAKYSLQGIGALCMRQWLLNEAVVEISKRKKVNHQSQNHRKKWKIEWTGLEGS